ncbi:MAG: LURP-one-related family protein [Candidatus Faecivivens sp.]|nr:LURP-one-related family protein [Oscillospiraceae bacterium]MDY2711789.1 LURP-one-related family protein [Candidatus Faecivivens sp.]
MRMLFKQRLFSWLDSYDIYDEEGNTLYTVEGQLSWGHCLKIYDAYGNEVGMVKEEIFTFLPRFVIWMNGAPAGTIKKEFSLFKPRFDIDYNGWYVEGSFMEWDYTVLDRNGIETARVSKELFHMTDTYVIDVVRDEDALAALMLVLAIDAEKCSRG